MPRREYKSKSRRRWKPRRKRRSPSTVVSLSRSPFPASIVTKMRYNETILLNPGISTPAVHYFSANGLYDPNITGSGHQPLGFDQYTPIYDHYTVLGSRITIRAVANDSSTPLGANMVGVYTNDDTTAVTSYDTVIEQGKGNVKILSGASATGQCTVAHNFSTKKFFGVTDVKDNDQLKGSSSTNPGDGAFFVVFAQGLDAATNQGALFANVTIDYIVQWSEQRSLAQS